MKKLLVLFMLISLITKAQSDLRIKKNEDQKKSSMRNDLGNNIISFSPFVITFQLKFALIFVFLIFGMEIFTETFTNYFIEKLQ